MKVFLKNLLIFLVVVIISFYFFCTKNMISFCQRYQIDVFPNNGYNGRILEEKRSSLDTFKIKGLGASILNTSELIKNDQTDEFYANGYSVWKQFQLLIWSITDYNYIAIILGISYLIGYNVIYYKRNNKLITFLCGFLIPIVLFPLIYYIFRMIKDKVFIEHEKIIEYGIIYTILFFTTFFVLNKKSLGKIV